MQKIKHDMNKTPMSPSAAGWIFGTVTKADPLEITIESGLTLPAEVLALSPFASEWKINTTDNAKDEGYFNFKHKHKILGQKTETQVLTPGSVIAAPTISGSAVCSDTKGHKHVIDAQETEDALYDIRMWRGLISGDNVLLSRIQGGQQYVVWFRVSFLDNKKEEPDPIPPVVPPTPAVPEEIPAVGESATVAVTCTALLLIPSSVVFSGVHYNTTKEADGTRKEDGKNCSGVLVSGLGSTVLIPGYWTFSCEYEGTKYSTSDMIFVPFGGTAEATLS